MLAQTCRYLCIAGLTALFFSACTRSTCGADKTAFLDQYHDLLEEARSADLPASDPGWSKYDAAFRSYVEECYDIHEPEMTGREKRQFWRQSLRYYYQRYGDGLVKELKGKDKSTLKKIQEETKAIFDEPDALFDDAAKGLKEDWQELKERFE